MCLVRPIASPMNAVTQTLFPCMHEYARSMYILFVKTCYAHRASKLETHANRVGLNPLKSVVKKVCSDAAISIHEQQIQALQKDEVACKND